MQLDQFQQSTRGMPGGAPPGGRALSERGIVPAATDLAPSTGPGALARGPGRPPGVAFWRTVVSQQAASGLSVEQYCRSIPVAPSCFYRWKKRFLDEPAAPAGASASRSPLFAPVRVVADGPAASGPRASGAPAPEGRLELWLPGKRRVRITGTVPRQQLADLLSLLEGE